VQWPQHSCLGASAECLPLVIATSEEQSKSVFAAGHAMLCVRQAHAAFLRGVELWLWKAPAMF